MQSAAKAAPPNASIITARSETRVPITVGDIYLTHPLQHGKLITCQRTEDSDKTKLILWSKDSKELTSRVFDDNFLSIELLNNGHILLRGNSHVTIISGETLETMPAEAKQVSAATSVVTSLKNYGEDITNRIFLGDQETFVEFHADEKNSVGAFPYPTHQNDTHIWVGNFGVPNQFDIERVEQDDKEGNTLSVGATARTRHPDGGVFYWQAVDIQFETCTDFPNGNERYQCEVFVRLSLRHEIVLNEMMLELIRQYTALPVNSVDRIVRDYVGIDVRGTGQYLQQRGLFKTNLGIAAPKAAVAASAALVADNKKNAP